MSIERHGTGMSQMEINWDRAQQAMDAAADHADRVHTDWKDRAYDLLLRFAREYRAPFICQQARSYAERRGLEQPPTLRAWGSIISRAARDGKIRRVGARYNEPDNGSNPALVSEWVGAGHE